MMKGNDIDFVEYFDPYNPEHLAAYDYLSKNGIWPEGFVPSYEQVPMLWLAQITAKMARALVDLTKNDQIIGFGPFTDYENSAKGDE